MRWRLSLFPLLLGCASTSMSVSQRSTFESGVMIGSRIERVRSGESTLELLQRTTPIYLHARWGGVPGRGGEPIAVYIDGLYSGDLDALRMIPAYDIVSVRRVNTSEAASLYGRTHMNGALLLRLRK
jgi:hypothetical protein